MKRMLSTLLAVLIVASCLTCLVSCGDDDGAQISVYLSDRVWGFDPAADYSDDATLAVMYMLYEPLFTLSDDGDVEKAMAEDYEYDEETGVLTVILRESYWSNGDRVTANDYVSAWQRLLAPGFQSDAAPLFYDVKNALAIKNAEEGVSLSHLGAQARDISTLEITFEKAGVDVDAFLRNLTNIATAPVNQNSLSGQEAFWSNTTSTTCYTNGAFKVEALDNAYGYFTISRNDGYHRPARSGAGVDKYVLPHQIRTVWNIDPNSSDLENIERIYDEFAKKTVFYMGNLSLADRKEAKDDAKVNGGMSTYSYLFDTTNPIFEKPEVRVILSSVIDRNHIVDLITFGKAATGLVNDSVWESDSSKSKNSFRNKGGNLISSISVEDAKSELDRLKAYRGGFSITCQDREEDVAVAEYVAGLWNQLGYTVQVKPVSYEEIKVDTLSPNGEVESSMYYRTSAIEYLYEKREFDVIALDWQMFSTNAFATLAGFSSTMNGQGVDLLEYNTAGGDIADYFLGNAAGYKSEAYDAAIQKAYDATDLATRSAHLHEAEKILMEDMPIAPLVFNQSFYVINSRNLKNLDVNYYGFTVWTDAKLKNYDNYFFKEDV